MAINYEIVNGVGLVTVNGSLNSAIVESFRNQFAAWFQGQSEVKQVVVDLGSTNFLDSSGLGALISTYKRVAERGGKMSLARPHQNVKMVLEITCINRILKVFGSLEEALQAAGG